MIVSFSMNRIKAKSHPEGADSSLGVDGGAKHVTHNFAPELTALPEVLDHPVQALFVHFAVEFFVVAHLSVEQSGGIEVIQLPGEGREFFRDVAEVQRQVGDSV